MASLKVLLGLYPKTAELEAKRASLEKEYTDLLEYLKSAELAEYTELEKIVPTADFENRKKEIKSQKFSETEEYRKEKEFLRLQKDPDIKNFLKIKSSVELKSLKEFEGSDEYKNYKNLEKFLGSEEYKQAKYNSKPKDFKNTPEYRKEQEFNSIAGSHRVKTNLKFKNSKNYQRYLVAAESEKLVRYEELKEYISTEEFKKTKEYMLLSGNKKYELSDEYKKEKRYHELNNSDRIKWYKKVKDSPKFDEIKNWKLTFSENFENEKLDRKKWITKYFWGESILHDSYSLADEKQCYTDGKNLEIHNSVLKIVTRKEKAEGKAWNPKIGFFPRQFEYTSGLINTGASFRQKYGIFEAKIRFGKKYPVNQTFWMLSDQILPHIDVAKAQKKLQLGNFWGNLTEPNGVRKFSSKVGLSKLSNDFYIYRLEWTPGKLVWKINGLTIATATAGVPQDPMYLNFSSALYKDTNGTVLPASMEIDWVRCYQEVE
ncbi:MAG: family 16 glycosylhydrolase [Candidatus Atribacteria bacterium]|nr:family 16 glycosylhydrolase [Candidatus Atribacteria bacterium]